MTEQEADDYLVSIGCRRPHRYVAVCDACGIGGKVMSFEMTRRISNCPYCAGPRREATPAEAEMADEPA
jgi:hypothetical protein